MPTDDPKPPVNFDPSKRPTSARPHPTTPLVPFDDLAGTASHEQETGPSETGAYSTADQPAVHVDASTEPFPVIAGYEVEAEIARGGMGVVYRARHLQLNRLAAIKMILGHTHSGESARLRFLIEAEAAASLEHPHVVRVFEFREQGRNSLLVMEYLAGGSLDGRFAKGRMPAREAAELLAKVARGVAAAHDLDIVHRDLKPGNILFDSAGEPKVTDFGLAKRPAAADLTATEAVMGTPAYMAPEQAAGRTKHVGPPADVWAIGVMLYEATAGHRPFQAPSTAAVMVQVQTAEPPPLRGIPRDFITIVERCLAKEPERRYPSAAELADDLERFARGEPILARPVGRIERTLLWARRKPTLAAVYALTILVAILGGLGTFSGWAWRQAESAREQLAGEQTQTESARQEAVAARDQVSREKLQTESALREVEAARTALQRTNAELDLVNYLSTVDLAYRSSTGGTQLLETRALLNDCNPKLRNWEWHYLDRIAHPELHLLEPEGLSEIERKQFYFLDAKFSPDGNRLFAVGTDPFLRVWDIRTGKLVASQKTESIFLKEIQISRDGQQLLTCGFGSVQVWSVEPLKVQRTIPLPPMEESHAWFTPDGKHVVLAPLKSSSVRVLEIATGKDVKSFEVPPTEQVWAAGFPEGQLRLVTLDRRNPNDFRPAVVRIRDVERGSPPVVMEGITPSPGARVAKAGLHAVIVDVSPDGRRVVVSASTGLASPAIWEEGEKVLNRVTSIPYSPASFSPDGDELLATSGGRVTRTDSRRNLQVGEYHGHPELLRFATMSPNRKRVAASGGQGQPLRVWDGERSIGPVSYPRTTPEKGGQAGLFSPDGKRYLTREADGSVREFDTTTGAEVRVLTRFGLVPNPSGSGESVLPAGAAYSSDSRRVLLSARRDNDPAAAAIIRVFDTSTGTLEVEVPDKGRRGGSHAFTADGSGIYITDDALGVGVWDLKTRSYRGAIPEVRLIQAVSPCGRYLLTDDTPVDRALPERRASLRDAKTGRIVAALEAFPVVLSPDSIWLTAAFTRDGERVAIACPDLKVRIWDSGTGKLVNTVRDLSNFPKVGLSFTPDGQRLATIGFGVDMWDVQTGRAVVPRSTIRTPSRSVAFTADGRTLLLGGVDRTLFTRIESGRITNP